MTGPPLPHPIALRHPDIAALVECFYERARADALLGPVFNSVVADWPHHVRAITAFWAVQLHGRGSYRGQPTAAHLRHAGLIRPEMFACWLEIWRQTTSEMMSAHDAKVLQAKAFRIAEVLGAAVASANSSGQER